MIAALYVETDGAYFGDPEIDPWDIERDARRYTGTHPVVAHPPCTRWCQLAGVVEARYGHPRRVDGGCFAWALHDVRRCGGVLEHPAYSLAWETFALTRPPREGGWVAAGDGVGWTCHVEQGNYGHAARKATWLYAVSTDRPRLRWGPSTPTATVSFMTNHGGGNLRRLSKREASATPPEFRAVLLDLARSVRPCR